MRKMDSLTWKHRLIHLLVLLQLTLTTSRSLRRTQVTPLPPKQFTIRSPPLKLVTTLFHEGPHPKVDPRKLMVDDVKELDGAVKNPNDHTLTPRMQKMERLLLHLETPQELARDAVKKRVETDQKEMSNRLKAWRSKHSNNNNNNNNNIDHEKTSHNHHTRHSGEKTAVTDTRHNLRFTRTKTDLGGPPKDQYVTTVQAGKATEVPKGMSEADKAVMAKTMEHLVTESEKLENAEVIEHTGEEDPENVDHLKGAAGDAAEAVMEKLGVEEKGASEKTEQEEGLDGPDNGGGGEETPIYKWYKWWNIQNWDEKMLQSMVNSPTHGQLNTDIGGKRSETNTKGDDSFAAQMADASSGTQAIEGEGAGEKKEDGAVKCTDCTPFPAWTRKDNWVRTDANFAQDGIVPPTEQDQKELQDAMESQLPQKEQLNDALDPARTAQMQANSNVGAGPMQNTLNNVMNQGVNALE